MTLLLTDGETVSPHNGNEATISVTIHRTIRIMLDGPRIAVNLAGSGPGAGFLSIYS
jgi:hypothetical protein